MPALSAQACRTVASATACVEIPTLDVHRLPCDGVSGSQGIGGSRRFGAHGSRNSGRSYPIGELMKLQTGVGCLKFWVRACLVAAHLCGPHVIASSKKLSISGRVHAFPKVQLHDLKRLTASAESGMQHTPQESDRTARRPRTVAAVQEKTRSCKTTLTVSNGRFDQVLVHNRRW